VSAPLRRDILAWYQRHKRDLPWRRTRDPYAIWVSEIMLQQTRVETVIPFYERFLRRFPDVAALARAREATVLGAWSGLGYYRRAQHLHAAARAVVREHQGNMPRTREGLLTLPGIGEYTASAIASIAFGQEEAAVDGNVIRVLARIHGLRGQRDSSALRRRVDTIAQGLARGRNPGDWTQALMELGATTCLPREPLCDGCPAARSCAARDSGDPARYPEAMPLKAPRVERRLLLLARRGDRVLLVPEDGKAGASWTLPSARLRAATATPRAARALAERHLAPSSTATPSGPRLTFQHRTYSHDLTFEVWSLDTDSRNSDPGSLWATRAQLRKLPLRAPTLKALKHIDR
jgi:A/G-specific adenine glycosylase